MRWSPVAGVLLLIVIAPSAASQAAAVRITKLSPTEVEYQTYTEREKKTERLDGLALWSPIPEDQSPIGWMWNHEPDFKAVLLRNGLAKLQNYETSPPNLRQAQDRARAERLGMWKAVPLPSEPPVKKKAPVAAVEGTPWETWLSSLGRYFLAFVTLFGGWQLVQLVWAFLHRHQVALILLGEPNTGKSWLWHRLVDPTMTPSELEKVARSDAAQDVKLPKMPLGRYEIVPIYKDIPGSQSGEQLTELLDRRRFRGLQRLVFKQRRVWLVVLAPSVTNDGSFDRDDLQQQLGALKLPTAVISSNRTPKPTFVAICVAKADLFMQNPPDDSTSHAARASILKAFEPHITLLTTVCDEHEVKHALVVCSALRGWNTDRILKALERACYTGQ